MKKILFIVFFVSLCALVYRSEGKDVKNFWAEKEKIEIEFQNKVAELLLQKAPEYKKIIEKNRDLGIELNKLADQMNSLVENEPGNNRKNKEDLLKIPGYTNLEEQAKKLFNKIQREADPEKIREILNRPDINPEFLKLYNEVEEKIRDIAEQYHPTNRQ